MRAQPFSVPRTILFCMIGVFYLAWNDELSTYLRRGWQFAGYYHTYVQAFMCALPRTVVSFLHPYMQLGNQDRVQVQWDLPTPVTDLVKSC